jgi:hypothetical protein
MWPTAGRTGRAASRFCVGPARALEALVIEHEPLPKPDGDGAADSEPERQHHVQVVVGYVVMFSVGSSCSEKTNNCSFGQLAVLEDMLDVLADGPLASIT